MMMKKGFFKITAFVTLTVLISCGRSPLGPDISDRPYDDAPSPGTVTCTKQSGHKVYYGGSTVSLSYTCDADVTSLSATGAPSFLTGSSSGKTVTYSGTAGTSASAATWSFAVNDGTALGDGSSISTSVLATSGLAATLGSLAMSSNNNTAVDAGLQLALNSTWDGSMADVSLTATGISTDMHGISLATTCTGATAPYLCLGDNTNVATTTKGAGLNLKWRWSAFDQGNYFLSVTPSTTIESKTTALSAVSSTFTIPIQSTGNVALTSSGTITAATFTSSALDYPYGISINAASSVDKTPVVGLNYFTDNGVKSVYFTRLSLDRTDDPTGGSNGVTQSGSLDMSNSGNSKDGVMKYLSATNWISLQRRANGSEDNVFFNKVTDSATAPTLTNAGVELSTYSGGGGGSAKSIDMTDVFTDADGTTRFGYSFARNARYLTVAKGNPAFSTTNTINDDNNYRPTVGGGAGDYEIDTGAATCDRTHIKYNSESSVGYFYVGYRSGAALKMTKLRATKDGTVGYETTTASLLSGSEFTNAGSANFQTYDFAVGTNSGSPSIGVVYREDDAANAASPNCYFKEFNSSLVAVGSAIALTSRICYWPNIHWHAAIGKFVITYSEQKSGNTDHEIKAVLVTPGATSASTALVVSDLGAISASHYPVALKSALYPAGNWVGLVYRMDASTSINFHGFHVPGSSSIANP